jgi:ribosomal protein S18 acetylase RimI-like enzyme
MKGEDMAAYAIAVLRTPMLQIPFVHVLKPYRDQGIEQALLRQVVQVFQGGGVAGIVCECVSAAPLDLWDTFEAMGFRRVQRELMSAKVSQILTNHQSDSLSTVISPSQFPDVARCLVDAYDKHPGHDLHFEVRDPEHALDFIQRVVKGHFGVCHKEYVRGIGRSEHCVGAILGCEVFPAVGFVIQLFVQPACQNTGLGGTLLCGLTKAFQANRVEKVALGVSRDNPARNLYRRFGFETLQQVDAYVWWAA